MLSRRKKSDLIKAEALRLGFNDCGFSPAEFLEGDAKRLKDWLDKGMHGEMTYMENHFTQRSDPREMLPEARSVISVILSYNTLKTQFDKTAPVVSKYAYRKDYHKVLKKRLRLLVNYIRDTITPCEARIVVDSAPLLERAVAARAGLGWIGKNSMLISPRFGSFIFLGNIITDLGLEYGKPIRDLCGGCTKCLAACPTKAIVKPRVVDARRCILYYTIEYKGGFPGDLKKSFQNRVFGCDICQDVCPWNRKAPLHSVPEFEPEPAFLEMTRADWNELDEETYQRLFSGSAVKRAKFPVLRRNIEFLEA